MVENANTADISSIKIELDQALSTLDLALLEAGRSVAVVRNNLASVVELAARAQDMEDAMARAREQLAVPFDASGAPPLRAIPARDALAEIEAPVIEPSAQIDQDSSETDAAAVEEPSQAASIAAPDPSAETSRCLRLAVSSKSGNLDLKEVDSSVNENPAVIDVALLDYDGRQATLKLWINDAADPDGVREALLSSLRNHLGERDTELTIDFEEDSAA